MLAAVVLLAAPGLLEAQGCTEQDFIGLFGFYGTGWVVKSPVTDLTGPFARLGRFVSDGNGHLTFSSTASFNGHLIPQDFIGTYVMNPDCTFTTVVYLPDPINLPVHFVGTLADNGNEQRDLFFDPPGVVVTGNARKVQLETCANQDLSGPYQMELSGWTVPSFANTRVPFSALGKFDLDGAGGVVGKVSANYGGLPVVNEPIDGTYTVDSNCIFHLTYYTQGEGRGPNDGVMLKGVLIDRGTAAYLMVLRPSTATVLGSLNFMPGRVGNLRTEPRFKRY